MTDEDRDVGLGRVLDDAVRGLQPPAPPLAEIRRGTASRRGQRWLVLSAAMLAVLLGGLAWALVSLTGGGHPAPTPSAGVGSTVGPSTTPAAPPGPRCPLATTTGDFDGDGTPDAATLYALPRTGQGCHQAQYPSNGRPDLRLQVRFGSGAHWDRRFKNCGSGSCGVSAFTATDLDGDGRSELAVDIGTGASIDSVEFFRVDSNGIHPLRLAPSPSLQALNLHTGPAILGGSFDSAAQSPVSCQIKRDGTRVLVATRAERAARGWRVIRVEFQLRGDALHVLRSSHTTVRNWHVTGPSFDVSCP